MLNELYQFKTNYKQMLSNIISIASKYIVKNNIKSLILGTSGGIDSTLVAALARLVVDKIGRDIKIFGYCLNIESKEDEIIRGISTGRAFCDEYGSIYLTDVYKMIAETIMGHDAYKKDDIDSRIRRGNLKARTRMLKLFDLARANNGMVLSTDNLTELLLGFWTLHGDVGNYGMIQNLWKTEVYGLSSYIAKFYMSVNGGEDMSLALTDAIEAVPTDGLGVTNSDFDQIMPVHDKNAKPEDVYRVIDEILMSHVYSDTHFKDGISEVVDRYEATRFKRNDPYNIPREEIV